MKKSVKALIVFICIVMCAAFTSCSKKTALTDTASGASQQESSVSSDEESSLPTLSEEITSEPDESSPENTSSAEDDTDVYSEVLAQYKAVTDSIINNTFDPENALEIFPALNEDISYRWSNMIVELRSGLRTTESSFGYALYDMDKDGTQELFLIDGEYNIFAVFTAVNGEVKLLDAYWSRYYAMLLEDGNLYTYGSSGATTFESSIYKLNNGELEETLSFGCEDGQFYLESDGSTSELTEQEYRAQTADYPLYENHSQVNNTNGLRFIEI